MILGYGVFTTEPLAKDDFVVDYLGTLLSKTEGEVLEE